MQDSELFLMHERFAANAIEIADRCGLPLTGQNLMCWKYDDEFETHWTTIFDGVTDEAYDLMMNELAAMGWTMDVLLDMETRKTS